MTDDAQWDSQFKTKERQQAEQYSKLFPEIKAAQPAWKEDGTSIVPNRTNTAGISQLPPAQQPLPLLPSEKRDDLGLVIPRRDRTDDDDAEFVTMVIMANGALATADVLAKNVTPL